MLRAFRARLFDVQTELDREKSKKDDSAAAWIQRSRQLEAEVDWAKEMADRWVWRKAATPTTRHAPPATRRPPTIRHVYDLTQTMPSATHATHSTQVEAGEHRAGQGE